MAPARVEEQRSFGVQLGLDLVDRERFYVAHDQKLVGNITDLTWDTRIGGMDNRLVTTVAASDLNFSRPGAANFPHDFVPLFGFDPGPTAC